MEERLSEDLAIAVLARDVGLSASQLSRVFRRDAGVPPRQYLLRLRMTRARLLIERTSLSVAEVMLRVGANDPSHFARDFRRAYGLSPRALRRQLRLCGTAWRYLTYEPSG